MIRPGAILSRLRTVHVPAWAEDGRRRLVITGAAGRVGTVLRRELGDEFALRCVDVRRGPGVDVVVDLARTRALPRIFAGADAVIDLAGDSRVGQPWERVMSNNLPAVVNVLEGMRLAGVGRLVLASTNHVTGGYDTNEPYRSILAGDYASIDRASLRRIDSHSPIRPDGPYAAGKAFGEAAARLYADQHGMTIVCLRLGHVNQEGRPQNVSQFATFLTHGDLHRLVRSCLDAHPPDRFAIVYGVSANTWRYWDLDEARETVGYVPLDDAERFRAS